MKWYIFKKNRVNESPLRSRCYTIARMVRMISYTKGSQVILGATLPPDLPVIEKKQRDKHCQIVKYKSLLSSRTDHQTLRTSPKVRFNWYQQLISTLATALLNRHMKKAWILYQFVWETKKWLAILLTYNFKGVFSGWFRFKIYLGQDQNIYSGPNNLDWTRTDLSLLT